tara:strand:- start:5491 stop:6114 length:624 start_codon:yes stop_codon:yes gene_type:complete
MKKISLIFLIFFISQIFANSEDRVFDKNYDLLISGHKEEAIKNWQKLAKEGDTNAKYALAILYSDAEFIGLCSIKDFCKNNYKKAQKLYEELYDEGDPRAAYALAEIYDFYWRFNKAFKYYLFAAERGVPEAQYNVANMYERGEGTRKDLVQSVRWYLQCNLTSLCGAGEEGISDLIDQISEEEFEEAKSLLVDDLEPVDIRLTSIR